VDQGAVNNGALISQEILFGCTEPEVKCEVFA
jgi:hypothetical protein